MGLVRTITVAACALLVALAAVAALATGATFGGEETISPDRWFEDASATRGPQIVVDGSGNAFYEATHSVAGDDQIAIYERCGGGPPATWARAAVLGDDGKDARPVGMGVAADGTALAVWLETTNVSGVIRSSVRPPGGSWQAPETITTDGASTVDVAMGTGGDAAVAWVEDSTGKLKVSVRPASSGVWGVAHEFPTVAPALRRFAIAVGPSGDVLVALHHDIGVANDTMDSWYRPAAGDWDAAPQTVATGLEDVQAIRLGFDAAGRAIIAYSNKFSTTNLSSRWRGAGGAGTWSVATTMVPSAPNVGGVAFAIHPQGAVLAWLEQIDVQHSRLHVRRFVSTTQTWDTATSFAPTPATSESYFGVSAATSASGEILVAAEFNTANDNGIVIKQLQVGSLTDPWPAALSLASPASVPGSVDYRSPRAAGGGILVLGWDVHDVSGEGKAHAISSGPAPATCPGSGPTTTTTGTTGTTSTTGTTGTTTTPPPTSPGPTTTTPTPTAEEKKLAAAKPDVVAQAFGLPTAKKCVSRRNFTIRLRIPKGVTVKKVKVVVRGKTVKTPKVGGRYTARVDLRKLPKGRFVVKLTVTTKSGKTLRGQRAYRTCVPRTRA